MGKDQFWPAVFYFSMLVLFIWLVLKVTGTVQSPLWFDYGIPVGSFMLGILAFFRGFMQQFAKVEVRISVLETRVDMGFSRVDSQFRHIDNRFSQVDSQISRIDGDVKDIRRALTRYWRGT